MPMREWDVQAEIDRRHDGEALPSEHAVRILLMGLTTEHDREMPSWEETWANTPRRYVNALTELLTREEFQFTTFEKPTGLDELIAMTGIRFAALCAHHMLPFVGTAHVAYVPQGKVAGLSKLARTVRYYSKGLWIQEDLTDQIADRLITELSPMGCAVVLQAEHLCYTIRGVTAPGTITTTSAMRGCFLDPTKQARHEFFELIKIASQR